MKNLIFAVLPLFLFAQDFHYPDTLFATTGRNYPCRFEHFSQSTVLGDFGGEKLESVALKVVDRITLGDMGGIFSKAQGYAFALDTLNRFCQARVIEQLDSIVSGRVDEPELISLTKSKPIQLNLFTGKPNNHFSIGFSYSPILTKWYYQRDYYYGSEIFTLVENVVELTPELTVYLSNRTSVFFNASYYATESSSKYFSSQVWSSSSDTSDYTRDTQLSVFSPQFGVKLLLGIPAEKKAHAYVALSGGKSFGKVINKYVNHQINDINDPIVITNRDEYESDLNSPIILNFSFGAEYQLNSALAFFVRGTFRHQVSSAVYHYNLIYDNGNGQTISDDREVTNELYFGGFGFHFYF
jgi:hypothetical protein